MLKRRLPVRDCHDLLNDGNKASGVHDIYLDKATKHVQVYCDMETDGGGWLVCKCLIICLQEKETIYSNEDQILNDSGNIFYTYLN